jgi:hypothetical protein
MRRVLLAVALMAFSGASVQAGWFGGGNSKLPKAIDTPILRPKVKDGHKVAPHVRKQPDKYNRPSWGANWDRLYRVKSRPLKPYLR